MHLKNILQQLGDDDSQSEKAKEFFKERNISFAAVEKFISNLK